MRPLWSVMHVYDNQPPRRSTTMKRMMSIAAIALMFAGSAALACDTCGCKAKKADSKKAACTACASDKACTKCDAKKGDAKKCPADCAKACCKK